MRRAGSFALLVAVALGLAACRNDPPPRLVTTTRVVGTWTGSSAATVGDIPSSSGRLRISWQAHEQMPGGGAFTLTVHSGVSGRPLETLVDHKGEGAGRVDFADDPRIYILQIESENVEWSVTVEEELGVYESGRS